MALELNVDAQEFVPSFSKNKSNVASTANTTTAATKPPTPPIMNLANQPNESYNYQSQSMNIPFNVNLTALPFQNQAQQFGQMNLSQNTFIKQEEEKLIALFPTIASTKLHNILQGNAYNLKLSILHILKSTELVGSFDQNICIYNLSNSCQHATNPSQCRYTHDREVPSSICHFWLQDTCIKGDQCPFLHRIPKKKIIIKEYGRINAYACCHVS